MNCASRAYRCGSRSELIFFSFEQIEQQAIVAEDLKQQLKTKLQAAIKEQVDLLELVQELETEKSGVQAQLTESETKLSQSVCFPFILSRTLNKIIMS